MGNLPFSGGAKIYNTGTTDIAISNIRIAGDFAQTNDCPATLIAATSCSLVITFTPTAAGARTGAITITDNSPGSPQIIQLTGTGTVPAVTLNPTSLTFPVQGVGTTSSAQAVTLTNSGGASLSITKISISGDFTETNTCGSSLIAGGSCTISVTFTPTTTGTLTGTVTIADNAANSPQMIGLTGTGGAAGLALGVAPGSSSSATVTAGDTATYKLTIGGQGIGGTATLSCTGAPTGATCSVPARVSMSATTASTVTVSVTTTAHTSALLFRPGAELGWVWAMGILGLVILPGVSAGRRSFLRVMPFALLLFICSCGGGSSSSSSSGGTPAGSYTLTVTASIGSTSQSQSLKLTVQ